MGKVLSSLREKLLHRVHCPEDFKFLTVADEVEPKTTVPVSGQVELQIFVAELPVPAASASNETLRIRLLILFPVHFPFSYFLLCSSRNKIQLANYLQYNGIIISFILYLLYNIIFIYYL